MLELGTHEPVPVAVDEPAGPALLEVKGLHAWYGESHVLHGVDLRVREGETVCLLGRNGAGKTTTLRAILGIVGRRQGGVSFDGRDLTRMPLHGPARVGLGYVPEHRGIFAGLTVAENLMLPPKGAEGGMSVDEIHALFPNLKERRTSPGTKLSGGEQQMLAIARILRTGPKMILLDEPTEGLAPVIVQRIAAALRQLKARGLTVLVVEQNFRFARNIADRFYVMEGGVVVDAFGAQEVEGRLDRLHELLGV
ncbi:ABC transporter ATP-binding protein [Methylobacterium iners]|uniref:High-affinity branched-chain amino acid transport ATP-binding protein LivF n=1 Tax=Methylobacterium iners TaxID=418707 RepID=A0ABQ4RV28_9HYPH|nr:ABC transporter ATP-binding protein [Methylobacterium iners]GJD93827.1 High-affinity branched-chain amino acid transport ATP-binding protein LivF [Methylobacterium iners]